MTHKEAYDIQPQKPIKFESTNIDQKAYERNKSSYTTIRTTKDSLRYSKNNPDADLELQIKTCDAEIQQLERTIAHTELKLLGLPDRNKNRKEKVLQHQYIDDL